jgi:hypothetical protein
MFWGCITPEGVGTFVPVDGIINSEKYVADLVLHQDSMEPTVHILFVLHAPSGPYTGGRVRKPSSTIKVGFYLKINLFS